MALDDLSVRFLRDHSMGRLSTVGPDGAPQNKPVGYSYNAQLGTIDIGGIDMEHTAKYRNVAVNPKVAFVVDDATGEGVAGMRFLEIRGDAAQVAGQPEQGKSGQVIRIRPRRLLTFNVDAERPGLQTRDVAAPKTNGDAPKRPALERGGAVARDAQAAVAQLVEELQAGWDQRDADLSNRRFANDVMWGSPFGATVDGYTELHGIHVRLKKEGRGGDASRFEVVRVLAPAPGVAVAQVRRVALDDRGEPVGASDAADGPFSEMALYVLVRKDDTWWLAAGQNTPTRTAPEANQPL